MNITKYRDIQNDIKYNLIKFIAKWLYDIDLKIVSFIIVISLFSIFLMSSISPAICSRIGVQRQDFFVTKHVIYILCGFFLMLTISMLNFDFVSKISNYVAYILLFSLVYLLIFGANIKGAKRWIEIGSISLQPSELLKPFFILINAKLLTNDNIKNLSFLSSILLLTYVIFCCVLEPDFGVSIVYIVIWSAQVIISGLSYYILIIIAFMMLILFSVGMLFFDHFRNRIITFFTTDKDHLQYQVKKSLESIEHGGYFGTGFGNGVVKYQLPDSHTDYIFATLSEEFGLIVSSVLILSFLLFILRIICLAKKEHLNPIKKNVLFGMACMFTMQFIINVGVSINLLPSKGMTLPFMSYGGSATITNFFSIGLILMLTRKTYHFRSLYGRYIDQTNTSITKGA